MTYVVFQFLESVFPEVYYQAIMNINHYQDPLPLDADAWLHEYEPPPPPPPPQPPLQPPPLLQQNRNISDILNTKCSWLFLPRFT